MPYWIYIDMRTTETVFSYVFLLCRLCLFVAPVPLFCLCLCFVLFFFSVVYHVPWVKEVANKAVNQQPALVFEPDHHSKKEGTSLPVGLTSVVSRMGDLAVMTSAQLRVKPRQRKGCITKHLGSLKRAIAESDTEAVTKRLEKTKLPFELFEQVQDALYEKLDDEAELTASEEWYAGVEEAYIQGVSKAHAWLKSHGVKQAPPVSSNPTDQSSVSDQDSLVNLLSIPKISIDKFQGDPLEYQAFFATFDELVDSITKDDRIKFTRLLQYTAGPAKQAINYCALVGGANGYSRARTILADRFGDKHILFQTIIADLKSGKHVSKSHELQQLADELKTACHTGVAGQSRLGSTWGHTERGCRLQCEQSRCWKLNHVFCVGSRTACSSVIISMGCLQRHALMLWDHINHASIVFVTITRPVRVLRNRNALSRIVNLSILSCFMLVIVNNDQTAHGTRVKQSADSSHVNCGGTNTHIPLVAVTVNSDERPVYALLDSDSTNSFISAGLSKRLHLRGPNAEYQMSILSNSGFSDVDEFRLSKCSWPGNFEQCVGYSWNTCACPSC